MHIISERMAVNIVGAALSLHLYEKSLEIVGGGWMQMPYALEPLTELHGMVRHCAGFPNTTYAYEEYGIETDDETENRIDADYSSIIKKYAEKIDGNGRIPYKCAKECYIELCQAAEKYQYLFAREEGSDTRKPLDDSKEVFSHKRRLTKADLSVPELALYCEILHIRIKNKEEQVEVDLPDDYKETVMHVINNSGLDEVEKQILHMYYWGHQSHQAIAQNLRITPNQENNRYHKSLRKMFAYRDVLAEGLSACEKIDQQKRKEAEEKRLQVEQIIEDTLKENKLQDLTDVVKTIFFEASNTDITDQDLPERVKGRLRKAGCKRMIDAILLTDVEMHKTDGVGRVLYQQIKESLRSYMFELTGGKEDLTYEDIREMLWVISKKLRSEDNSYL